MGRLGALVGHLGASLGPLGPSWDDLGAPRAVLEDATTEEANMLKMYVSLKGMGRFLPLRALLGVLWEPSWGVLGAFWAVLTPSGAVRKPPGPVGDPLGTDLGAPGGLGKAPRGWSGI